LAALRRPAGKFIPIFSNFSRSIRPPFLLFARRSTPPNSDAFKHSGGASRLCTSATVTLYLDVLDNRLSRPGTEQKISPGELKPMLLQSLLIFMSAERRELQVLKKNLSLHVNGAQTMKIWPGTAYFLIYLPYEQFQIKFINV
jgi:hypothetical protein